MEVLKLYIKLKKKHIIIFLTLILFFCTLSIVIHIFFMPISLRNDDIDKIIIGIQDENSGEACIRDSTDIKDVCDIVNHLILIPWNNYNLDELGGNTPTMEIYCERNGEVIWSMDVHNNMVSYTGSSFFYIPFLQRKRIENICRKYGKIWDW